LAALDDPDTFVALLRAELDRVEATSSEELPIQIVESLEQLDGTQAEWFIWVNGDVMVSAATPQQLLQVQAVFDGTASDAFAQTELHARLTEAYSSGVAWLFGLDMSAILANAPGPEDAEELELLDRMGLLDATTLVIERHRDGEYSSTSGNLDFAGPRRGIAAWLAPPAPMGSLDFISPQATMAAAAVAKDASDLYDELLALLASTDPDVIDELAAFQNEHGIDLRADLAATLGGEAAFAVDGPLLPTPSWKLVIEVYDPDSLQHTIETAVGQVNQVLASSGKPGLVLEETQEGGHTYLSLSHPKAPVQFHYVMVEGYLVAAPSRALLQAALQYRASGASLVNSAELRSLLPDNGYTDCSALVYRDFSGLANMLEGVNIPGIDPEAMPDLSAAGAPSLLCVYGEEERIVISGSGGSLLAAAPMLGLPCLFDNPSILEQGPNVPADRLSSSG
jgi:hypothetical protein